MTRVIFIRHGEAAGNIERRFHGFTNSALTENGFRQAALAAKRLENEHIDAAYSSDLTRAYETACTAVRSHGLTVEISEDFREINGGEWEDLPWDELPIRFPRDYDYWLRDPALLQMPGGESMKAFLERVAKAVQRVVDSHPDQTVLIATHGTVIKVLLAYYRGLTLSDLPYQPWHDNASISIVDFDADGSAYVVSEGENSHLGEYSTLAKQDWWCLENKGGKKMISRERVTAILEEAGVLLQGHFLLTSGRHSAKYLQCARIFMNAKYSEELCSALADLYRDDNIDVVIGPAIGAIQMSYEVSRQLGVPNLFAEREDGKMTLRRSFEIQPGQRVLVVEDVVTTGGSVREVIDLVRERGGVVVGVGSIVDRTAGKIDFGVPYRAVYPIEVESYEASECPLCKEGTPVVKPGSRKVN